MKSRGTGSMYIVYPTPFSLYLNLHPTTTDNVMHVILEVLT